MAVDIGATDHRPVTFADLKAFNDRLDSFGLKLDGLSQEFRAALDNKATIKDVETRTAPLQEQIAAINKSLHETNVTSAKINGSLDALLRITDGRVGDIGKQVDLMEHQVYINQNALAGMSSDFNIMRRDLYGNMGEGGVPTGLFRSFVALQITLTELPEKQAEATKRMLDPLNNNLSVVQGLVAQHESFISNRRRFEGVIIGAGKRTWHWFTERSFPAQVGITSLICTILGLVISPSIADVPFIESSRALLSGLINRLLGG